MTEKVLTIQPGRLTRWFDRVKRPAFMAAFLSALAGVIAGNLDVFLGGTFTFMAIMVVHLFMRRSEVPLLGHYLGMGRYLRVTRQGKVMLVLTVIIGMTAVNARINLLLLVMGMLLGLILISGFLSENMLRKIKVRLFLPSTAFAGSPFSARLTVANGKPRMPSYSLFVEATYEGPKGSLLSRSYVLKVPPERTLTLEQALQIDRRGFHRVKRISVGTRFPFGFFEKWSYHEAEAEVLMFPQLGRIAGRIIPNTDRFRHLGSAKVLNRAGNDEFWGVREYRDGDNPRLIHWRSSARLGKRVIRELHREESQRFLLLLDAHVDDPADEEALERFETAVSFAATLARHLLDQDCNVSFAAWGQDLVRLKAEKGKRQVRRIMRALAEIEPTTQADFPRLLGELDPRLRADTFAFAVMLDGSRIASARAELERASHNRFQVLSVDGPVFKALFQEPPK